MTKSEFFKNYKFPLILFASILLGTLLGLALGEKSAVLRPFGDVFLNLMFCAVVPLVFVTIASAVGNMTNMKRLGKILGVMLRVFFITGLIAAVVIIFAVKIFPPAKGVEIALQSWEGESSTTLSRRIVNALTVSDFNLLLSRKNMLPLIIFAVSSAFVWVHWGKTT